MKSNRPTPVLISAGHTGGHFFPAISFAETLRALHPDVEIHVLVSRPLAFIGAAAAHQPIHFHLIHFSSPPNFFSLKAVSYLLECTIAFLRTVLLFFKVNPRLVVGFGSYGTVPSVLGAIIFGIPILLHEQNAQFGRANQFLGHWAKQIAVSFPRTEGRISERKVFYSGFPLRSIFVNAWKPTDSKKPPNKPLTILIFGGSQGARRLNQTFLAMLATLNAEERTDIAVIHIVGNDGLDPIKQEYEQLGIQAHVVDFSSDIFEHYHRADLVIARAGAGTIFELAAFGRAAILVPYPHAYAHQKINARYLAQERAARVIEEEELNANSLRKVVLELSCDSAKRSELGENIRRLAKQDASEQLVKAAWKLVCEKN